MIKVGITGGIGAGKSLVCRVFKMFGIPVFDADSEAKKIISSSLSVKDSFISHFGSDIYFDDETLDKLSLAKIIFSDNKELEYVNSVIHPLVFVAFNKWSEQFSSMKYVIHESAILFESGANLHVDKTIVVTAPLDMRIKRVLQRDGLKKKEVEARIKNQWHQSKVVELADYEIRNDGQSLIVPRILELHKMFSGTI